MNLHTEMKRDLASLASPPTAPYHDPVWMVQRAWSVFRLTRLQELIRLTIKDLQALPTSERVAGDRPPGDGSDADPIVEAFRACCEELREASGMVGAEADRARHCREVRELIARQPPVWSATFTEALSGYRRAATHALEMTFAKARVA